jgi:hypothetical protein
VSCLSFSFASRQRGPARGVDGGGRPGGRLRCDARVGVAPPNSLRSPAVRCARTTAASQSTKRAARADPDAALLAAPHAPARRPPLALGAGCACLALPAVLSRAWYLIGAQTAGAPHRRRGGWGQVAATVGLAEERRAAGPRAQRATSSDWPQLSERSEPKVSGASSAAGPAARAPQGSRPSGPTEAVGRRRLPPSAVTKRRQRKDRDGASVVTQPRHGVEREPELANKLHKTPAQH